MARSVARECPRDLTRNEARCEANNLPRRGGRRGKLRIVD
jgi:hypothetical protein